jgi:hypothetical protein
MVNARPSEGVVSNGRAKRRQDKIDLINSAIQPHGCRRSCVLMVNAAGLYRIGRQDLPVLALHSLRVLQVSDECWICGIQHFKD